jgi:hypothetical protein
MKTLEAMRYQTNCCAVFNDGLMSAVSCAARSEASGGNQKRSFWHQLDQMVRHGALLNVGLDC